MNRWNTLLLSLLILLIGCAGKDNSQDIEAVSYESTYYGPSGKRNCFNHGDCGLVADNSAPVPPAGIYQPVPENPPLSRHTIFLQ